MVLITSLVTLGVELFFFLYLFDCAGSQLHHAGSSSLTRDRIQAPALGCSLTHWTIREVPGVDGTLFWGHVNLTLSGLGQQYSTFRVWIWEGLCSEDTIEECVLCFSRKFERGHEEEPKAARPSYKKSEAP